VSGGIRYRDTSFESGTFDEVVAVTEQRLSALKAKGFTESYVEIMPCSKTKDGEALSWQIDLGATKEVA
jgi:hypothetical protein